MKSFLSSTFSLIWALIADAVAERFPRKPNKHSEELRKAQEAHEEALSRPHRRP